MNFIDLILIISIGGFVLAGLWFGIIHMIGSVAGIVVGAYCAGRFYEPAANYILPFLGGHENWAKIIAFLAIFVLVNRLVGLVFYILEKLFKVIAVIPFLKTFNRLLGAVLGLVEGTLVIGLVVYFAGKLPLSTSIATELAASKLANELNSVGAILAPFLPETIRILHTIF
jgi:membrane protein required for colicin V production